MPDARIPRPRPSLRALCFTALDVLRTRAELISIEMAQEKARALRLALHAAFAVVMIGLGLQFATVFAVAWFWETPYRWAACASAAGLFIAAGAALAVTCAIRLRATRRTFDATLLALDADVEALR